MNEVDCPLCMETVDLGTSGSGTYECPYCEGEFVWESGKNHDFNVHHHEYLARKTTIDRKIKQLLANKVSKKNFSFPLLVGNHRKRFQLHPNWISYTFVFLLLAITEPSIIVVISIFYVLILLITAPFRFSKHIKRKRDFLGGVLDPEFLLGTGLVIDKDLETHLIGKRGVPKYQFSRNDIEKIVLREYIYPGIIKDTKRFELRIHLHGFHALTLFGFNEIDSVDIVTKMISIFDIELDYNYSIPQPASDGGGGGGG